MDSRALARRGVAVASAAVLILAAAPAAAQDPLVPHVTLGAAAGIATPFNGDFDFTATSWQADVRFETTRHLGFNLFVEEWRHTNNEVFGAAGRMDRVTTRTGHRTRVVGWNVLGRTKAGRATLSSGGGVSYLLYSREFHQAMTACEAASACNDFTRKFDNGSFAAQVQAGVEVPVAPHVAAMGQFRWIVPIQDPGGGHYTFMGGIRFVF
jgi:hypothetical protein